MAVDTLFQPQGGSGSSSSSDYTKDAFQDISRPGSNNTNLTSTASTNPLGFFLNDTDFPSFGVKTLWVKDLILIEDRSIWVNSQPTYEVEFTEYVPGVRAYVVGNARVRNSNKGKTIELRSVGDLFGVTAVAKQLAWIAQPDLNSSASATAYTDGISGSTLTFSSLATDANQGVTKYNVVLHSASVSSNNIHDFRVAALQAGGTLDIAGVIVYSDDSAITFRPGTSYNDKTIVATSVGATAAPYTVVGNLGAATVINKATNGAYTQTSQEPPNITSIGVGSSGTNLVNVTTGTGSSFAVGYAVVGNGAGSSQYFGIVTNVSTDTLTVSPTLAIGISGSFYKYYAAGPTFSISPSFYKIKTSLDFYQLNNTLQSSVFGATLQGEIAYVDPMGVYSVFSKDLQFQTFDGYLGLGFEGNTSAFLQIDGRFAAADIEYMSNGIIHGTFSINGVPSWSINAGSSGLFKKTIFTDAGPGWNSIVFSPGQSFIGTIFTKVNLYDFVPPQGVTAGLLAKYDSFANTVNRNLVQNATIMQLGAMQRVYADQLNLTGVWSRGATHTAAGGVYYGGASLNSVLNFQYFGKDFALIGTEGGSMTLTLDGASIGSGFNVLKSVPSMTWHTLALTWKNGATCVIQAVDYQPPSQKEFVSLQKTKPLAQLSTIPKTFIQTDTPREAKDGDFWWDIKSTVNLTTGGPELWLRAFGQWNKINIAYTTDDPKFYNYFRANGSSTGINSGAATQSEIYNFVSWTQLANSPTASVRSASSNSFFNGAVHGIDGENSSTVTTAMSIRFNKIVWDSFTTRSQTKSWSSNASFASFLYSNQGTTDGTTTNGKTTADKWSGSAWTTGTAWANAKSSNAAFVVLPNLSVLGGFDTAGSTTSNQETRNSADSVSSATNTPNATVLRNGSSVGAFGMISFASDNAASTSSFTWSGLAWSASITVPYTCHSQDGNGAGGTSTHFINGGSATLAGTPLATSAKYNLAAWFTDVSSGLSRNRAFSGNL